MVAFDFKLLVDNWKYNNSELAFFSWKITQVV